MTDVSLLSKHHYCKKNTLTIIGLHYACLAHVSVFGSMVKVKVNVVFFI